MVGCSDGVVGQGTGASTNTNADLTIQQEFDEVKLEIQKFRDEYGTDPKVNAAIDEVEMMVQEMRMLMESNKFLEQEIQFLRQDNDELRRDNEQLIKDIQQISSQYGDDMNQSMKDFEVIRKDMDNLRSDNDILRNDSDNAKVGINTTAPTVPLQVTGDISASGLISAKQYQTYVCSFNDDMGNTYICRYI